MTSLKTIVLQTLNYFKTLNGNIFLEPVFIEVRYSGLQGCSVREKVTVYKILGHYFLFVLFLFPVLY